MTSNISFIFIFQVGMLSLMLTRKQLADLKAEPLTGPNKLPVAMRLAKLTQEQLAEKLGTTQPRISKIVVGSYSKFPLENARQLSRFFGCSIEDLFPSTEREEASA